MKKCGYGDGRVSWGIAVAPVGPEVNLISPRAVSRIVLTVCSPVRGLFYITRSGGVAAVAFSRGTLR